MTSIEFLFNELWETPKDKFTWCFILNKAKEMHNKEIEISDEIIEDNALENWMKTNYDNPEEYRDGWLMGIQWYKKQLKIK